MCKSAKTANEGDFKCCATLAISLLALRHAMITGDLESARNSREKGLSAIFRNVSANGLSALLRVAGKLPAEIVVRHATALWKWVRRRACVALCSAEGNGWFFPALPYLKPSPKLRICAQISLGRLLAAEWATIVAAFCTGYTRLSSCCIVFLVSGLGLDCEFRIAEGCKRQREIKGLVQVLVRIAEAHILAWRHEVCSKLVSLSFCASVWFDKVYIALLRV